MNVNKMSSLLISVCTHSKIIWINMSQQYWGFSTSATDKGSEQAVVEVIYSPAVLNQLQINFFKQKNNNPVFCSVTNFLQLRTSIHLNEAIDSQHTSVCKQTALCSWTWSVWSMFISGYVVNDGMCFVACEYCFYLS